jgi:drug/metabolite transporter (DMT)-like permease
MSDLALGAVFAALAATAWAVGAIFARIGMQHMGSTTGTFISLVSGFLLTLAIALALDFDALFSVSLVTILWFAALGAIQFPIGRFLNYNGIRLAGVAPATAILGSSPLFAGVLALLFLGEQMTPMILVGILAVAAGLALVMSERRG